MNFELGVRRLAIFVGSIGAIIGGYYAHKNLANLPSQRAQHKFFENLAATDFVKLEQTKLLSLKASGAGFSWPIDTPVIQLAPSQPGSTVKGVPAGLIGEPIEGKPTKPQQSSIDYEALARKYGGVPEKSERPQSKLPADFKNWDTPASSSPRINIQFGVDSKRIKTVFWNNDLSVNFFLMDDDGIVDSYEPRSAWCYLLAVAYPALGFFVLWATIRAIAWVVSGFFQTAK